MNGRVKMYNEDRGFGFILGEDEHDYYFHISNVKTAEPISRGSLVVFSYEKGEKGLVANSIMIKDNTNAKHPTFIQLNETRIKFSNIKNYGITDKNKYFAKVYEVEPVSGGLLKKCLLSPSYIWKGKLHEISEELYNRYLKIFAGGSYANAYIVNNSGLIYQENGTNKAMNKDDIIIKTLKCLYITTYQGDNFQFIDGEVNFDILEKCKEIDSIML